MCQVKRLSACPLLAVADDSAGVPAAIAVSWCPPTRAM
jgi:hypothetical protein